MLWMINVARAFRWHKNKVNCIHHPFFLYIIPIFLSVRSDMNNPQTLFFFKTTVICWFWIRISKKQLGMLHKVISLYTILANYGHRLCIQVMFFEFLKYEINEVIKWYNSKHCIKMTSTWLIIIEFALSMHP